MGSIRWATAAALLLIVTVLGASAVEASAPVAAATLSGFVRDDVGRLLDGVEVLVLAPEGSQGGALGRAVSDAAGRFVVGVTSPGVYRIAAIKPGYLAALGRVNTVLRSSVDLVLRPVPKEGEPGSDRVQDDLSWTLRVPPRGILRDLDADPLSQTGGSGGARAFAARVHEAIRGEVDHVVALGSWRPGSSGASSSLEGNETRMRLGGSIGERGAIEVRGRRGTLDSSSSPSPDAVVSRGAQDVGIDVSYDTNVDENLAMRAFYSTGDLAVGQRAGVPGTGAHQSQRSWGYDAHWRKQVDAVSRVAVQVGFHDASLVAGQRGAIGVADVSGDNSNRAIGAEGSYENAVGEGHLVRVGVRAQRLSLSVPDARLGRQNAEFDLEGTAGWNLLIDSEDRWSLTGPMAMTYGLAVRQAFDGSGTTTLTPRIGGTWTAGGVAARAEVSYMAAAGGKPETADAHRFEGRSPYGYAAELKTRLDPKLTLRGSTSYIPSRANVWGEQDVARGIEALYVADGTASDRFIAIDLERVASTASVSFRVARGRAEGALAPALDDVPFVVLADRALDYDAATLGVTAPRAGSSVSLEYRAIRERDTTTGISDTEGLRTLALGFSQDLLRFAGGRATCRFLLTARSALGSDSLSSRTDETDTRRFIAEHKRIGAGVSLAF
jgi:hypothetical protein